MASQIDADILTELETVVADPQKRERLISLIRTVGGQSRVARWAKAAGFLTAALLIALRGPFDGANYLIAGAFATAAAAELKG